MRAAAGLLLATLAAGSVACGMSHMRVAALDELERVRATPDTRLTSEIAPEAYARAEQRRALALRAHAEGDDALARIYADHAIAAYQRAVVVVRLARASAEAADAQKSLDATTTQLQELEASRVELDRQASELEQRATIARQRVLPAQSAPASGDREAARLVVARTMVLEARLLCGAARLVSAEAPGLGDADASRAKLEPMLDKGVHPAPIDEAARARAACLEVLTRARRAQGGAEGQADGLLAELSASGGWDPSRDERGVVVTIRGSFRGKELADGWPAKLQELGRVAAAHPAFALQVVVHDADAPAAKDEGDARRAEAVTKALVDGGATAARIDTELAGARAPVVDPGDRKMRGRNERIEVVFVATGGAARAVPATPPSTSTSTSTSTPTPAPAPTPAPTPTPTPTLRP